MAYSILRDERYNFLDIETVEIHEHIYKICTFKRKINRNSYISEVKDLVNNLQSIFPNISNFEVVIVNNDSLYISCYFKYILLKEEVHNNKYLENLQIKNICEVLCNIEDSNL